MDARRRMDTRRWVGSFYIRSSCHVPASGRVRSRDLQYYEQVASRVSQSPKSPNPDLSYVPLNDVSCPYEHLVIGEFGVWCELQLVARLV